MFFRHPEADPEFCVGSADKVLETHEAISVRPAGVHPFGGCISAIIPTLGTGAILALLEWITGGSWHVPAIGAGCVYLFFYIHYHVWNFRRKRDAHNLIVDKVLRRIHFRDRRSRKRVSFSFDDVQSITDRNIEHLGYHTEILQFSLRSDWLEDHNPPVSHFQRDKAHPMSLWKTERIESGLFGDLIAEVIGCPISHTK